MLLLRGIKLNSGHQGIRYSAVTNVKAFSGCAVADPRGWGGKRA